MNMPCSLRALALSFFCVCFLSGCGGGGGGGGSSTAKLNYVTDWTDDGRAPAGESQRVTVRTLGGVLVASVIVNHDSTGLQATDLSGFEKGTYLVRAELNTMRDFAGDITGVVDKILAINGATQFVTDVGEDVASVDVSPEAASIKVQETKRFTATAIDANGNATFVPENAFTWSTNGAVATVDETGLVTGTAEGQGSVVAQETGSGLQGSSVLTVSPFNATRGKWTILVYLNAANDLYKFSDTNVNQMEKASGNPDVRFVVQWKQAIIPNISPSPSFVGTRRYVLEQDTSNTVVSPVVQDMGNNVDMGLASTMRDFISWGQTYYPADHYVLVVWNHGNGWKRTAQTGMTRGVSYDDQTGHHIDTWDMAQAIGDTHLDILAWDSSLMQMIEVADDIKDQVDLIVGSEESPPGEGYPYNTVFAPFKSNPDLPAKTLAKSFVDATLAVPGYVTRNITQSVIDSSKIDDLNVAISSLADALIANKDSIGTLVQNIRSAGQSYEPPPRYYYDLYDVCLRLENGTNIPAISNAAANVRSKITAALVYEGHNANSPGSHGIAIDFSPKTSFQNYDGDYSRLRFATETNWDDWLRVAP